MNKYLPYSGKEVKTTFFQKPEDTGMNFMITKQRGEEHDETIDKSEINMNINYADEEKKEEEEKSQNSNVISEITESHMKGDESIISSIKENNTFEGKLQVSSTNISYLQKASSTDISTGVILRTNVDQTAEDEINQKEKNFSNTNTANIRKKEKIDRQIENIFSEEHITKREAEQFSFLNIFLHGNLLLNIITRSNSLFTRPTRCILLFLQIYFYLFWSTVLISGQVIPLNHPQERKEISGVEVTYLWMPLVVPIFVTFVMYVFASIFKLNEGKVFVCKSIRRYRRVRNEIQRECIIRRIIGLLFTAIAVVGMTVYIIRFSANYGWKASYQCILISLLSLVAGMIIYDGFLAFFLSFLYRSFRNFVLWIHSYRRVKQAELQE